MEYSLVRMGSRVGALADHCDKAVKNWATVSMYIPLDIMKLTWCALEICSA